MEFTIKNKWGFKSLDGFSSHLKPETLVLINMGRDKQKLKAVKVNFNLAVIYMITNKNGNEKKTHHHLQTQNYAIFESTDLDEMYENAVNEIKSRHKNLELQGSQFALISIDRFDFNIA